MKCVEGPVLFEGFERSRRGAQGHSSRAKSKKVLLNEVQVLRYSKMLRRDVEADKRGHGESP